MASAAWSRREAAAGSDAALRCASQLRVKLGVTRPPIRAIMVAATPSARRSAAAARPGSSGRACTPILARANKLTRPQTGRLRQLRPARTSRQTTAAKTTRNAESVVAAHSAAGAIIIATRPASQRPVSAISGAPMTGSRPVQLGTAVNRKPAMTPVR